MLESEARMDGAVGEEGKEDSFNDSQPFPAQMAPRTWR